MTADSEIYKPPVAFLVFNRPDCTRQVFEEIRRFEPTQLLIVADGPRASVPTDAGRCEEVRKVVEDITWPCEVLQNFAESNLGCKARVSSGLDWVFSVVEEAIILEDDCLPTPSFFPFCEELLRRYRNDQRIMAICGSNYVPGMGVSKESYYFSYYPDIWGWATWRRAWGLYDRDLTRWAELKRSRNSGLMSRMARWRFRYWEHRFDLTAQGRIDTWDYQWMFTVIESGGLACYPTRNLISNLGFATDATHTKVDNVGALIHAPANLPLETLDFPLVHPSEVRRTERRDRQIERKRLDLAPPTYARRAWNRCLRSIKRAGRILLGPKPPRPDKFLKRCRAIIHVGANEGQERALYDGYSLSVLWVEALPDVYSKLVDNLSGYPGQQAVNALVTDKDGELYDFHVSNNSGESSSLYEFLDHKELWPEVGFDRTIRLRSTTLEALLRSRGLSTSRFDALVLDVQGAELLVVLGGGDLLRHVRYIKAEVADFESYKGACTYATLTQALAERGFVDRRKECFASKSGVGSYFDVLYERVAR